MALNLHRHHLIPKHLGGGDEEENLTPPISIALHAAFHKDLYEQLGNVEDYIAWKALSGRLSSEEARLMAAKSGQEKSEKYKNRGMGPHLASIRSKDSCSKGGKVASIKLTEWISQNKETHSKMCSENAKKLTQKKHIPHSYKGVVYESKKALQKDTGLSNTGFYNKLGRGEILRLPKDRLSEVMEVQVVVQNSK